MRCAARSTTGGAASSTSRSRYRGMRPPCYGIVVTCHVMHTTQHHRSRVPGAAGNVTPRDEAMPRAGWHASSTALLTRAKTGWPRRNAQRTVLPLMTRVECLFSSLPISCNRRASHRYSWLVWSASSLPFPSLVTAMPLTVTHDSWGVPLLFPSLLVLPPCLSAAARVSRAPVPTHPPIRGDVPRPQQERRPYDTTFHCMTFHCMTFHCAAFHCAASHCAIHEKGAPRHDALPPSLPISSPFPRSDYHHRSWTATTAGSSTWPTCSSPTRAPRSTRSRSCSRRSSCMRAQWNPTECSVVWRRRRKRSAESTPQRRRHGTQCKSALKQRKQRLRKNDIRRRPSFL